VLLAVTVYCSYVLLVGYLLHCDLHCGIIQNNYVFFVGCSTYSAFDDCSLNSEVHALNCLLHCVCLYSTNVHTVLLVLHVYVLFGHCFFTYAYSCSVFDCLLNSVTVYRDHASCCLLNCFIGRIFLLLIVFIYFCYIFFPCFLTSYNAVIVQLVCVLFVDCSLNVKAINSMKV